MPKLRELRKAAHQVFNEALRAGDAGAAVHHALRLKEPTLQICDLITGNRLIYSVAVGKAALTMGYALEQALGQSLAGGVLVGPRTTLSEEKQQWLSLSALYSLAGGHPLPNRQSLWAAEQAFELLEQANKERALIIFLISGGGSAMMEWPIDRHITLPNLRMANKTLISSGASISEINAVRRAFSAVKGGRLAARAPNCEQITLIVSDVPNGEEHNVASGPTLPPPADAPAASEVVARYGLTDKLPASVLSAIKNPPPPITAPPRHEHFVLLNNDTALEAAATASRTRGFAVEIARDISDEPVEIGCEKLLTRLASLKDSLDRVADARVCLISGGEFACPVRGDGIGGRNLETALRLAIAADHNRDAIGEFVALCAGTDGIDGNSPAAGAIVDSTTIERARAIGLDANDFLDRSDAYSFFSALGDAITTGPTGTNVRDLRILLKANRS
jgi:hydroxypyruvate reductase